jgi:cytochrome c biogenesis protein CcdA
MLTTSEFRDDVEETGFRWLLAGLGALPLLSYFALFIFACLAFRASGHWPSMNYPDPKSFGAAIVSGLWVAFAITACATPVYFVMIVLQILHLRSSVSRVDAFGLGVYLAGLMLWLLASKHLLGWFLD